MSEARPFQSIAVRELAEAGDQGLELELVAGKAGLPKLIIHPRIQKAALAVTGFTDSLHEGRVQVLGESEVSYLKTVGVRRRQQTFKKICEACARLMIWN